MQAAPMPSLFLALMYVWFPFARKADWISVNPPNSVMSQAMSQLAAHVAGPLRVQLQAVCNVIVQLSGCFHCWSRFLVVWLCQVRNGGVVIATSVYGVNTMTCHDTAPQLR